MNKCTRLRPLSACSGDVLCELHVIVRVHVIPFCGAVVGLTLGLIAHVVVVVVVVFVVVILHRIFCVWRYTLYTPSHCSTPSTPSACPGILCNVFSSAEGVIGPVGILMRTDGSSPSNVSPAATCCRRARDPKSSMHSCRRCLFNLCL